MESFHRRASHKAKEKTMSDQFLGEIRIVPFNFAPYGWATCDGQIMPISQNTALFSLFGVNYGGDGKSNFGLPNFQGSVPISQGAGPGLTERLIGETGGSPTVTLLSSEMAAHTHNLIGDSDDANATDPTGALPGLPASSDPRNPGQLYNTSPPTKQMCLNGVSPFGGGLPHENMMPYLTLLFIVALSGVYPPRQ